MRRPVSTTQLAGPLDLDASGQAVVSKTMAGAVLASMRSDILELKLVPGAKLPFEALRFGNMLVLGVDRSCC